MGNVNFGDVGKSALVNGISLEGKSFRGAGEIMGISSDMFGESVQVKVDGEILHFRQNTIGDVVMDRRPDPVPVRKEGGGCLLIPLLLGMLGLMGAFAGVHHLLI